MKYIINKYNYPIEIYDEYEMGDNSSHNFFDTLDEVKKYPEIISNIMRLDPERILLMDFFFPGIDTILYANEIKEKKIKIGALMHGGSFLPGDLYRWDWLNSLENFWFNAYEVLYVGSEFFRNLIPQKYQYKVKANHWGLYGISFPSNTEKKYSVVFPHRLSEDKGVMDFYKIAQKLPKLKFVVTSYDKVDHNEYAKKLSELGNVAFAIGEDEINHLNTLASSKIVLSCATQETYGYSMAKAVMSGCIPVVPNREVYPELYPNEFIYNSIDEAVKLISNFSDENSEELTNKTFNNFKSHSFIPLLRDFFELE